MISGVATIQGLPEESICKISLDYHITDNWKYCVYPISMLPSITFDKAATYWEPINKFWLNDSFNDKCATKIKLQNYISARYGGRLPRIYYGDPDPLGTEFTFIMVNSDIEYRYFADRTNDQYRNVHAADTNTIYSR
jgi:hypothetical protein